MQISEHQLEISKSLPKQYKPVTLQGSIIWLEPYESSRDAQVLFQRTNGEPFTLGSKSIGEYDSDEFVWKYLPYGPFQSAAEFDRSVQERLNKGYRFFNVFDKETSSQVGFIAKLSNFPEHLKVEIGSVVFCPLAQGTNMNLEANYLLLNHSFELGYRRVEWKCDVLNQRSRRAAERIGFKYECTQDCQLVVKGRYRTTAWLRILEDEWPDTKVAILEKLSNPRP
jgi:RimJ/RimL family protein N-acetyltransferase